MPLSPKPSWRGAWPACRRRWARAVWTSISPLRRRTSSISRASRPRATTPCSASACRPRRAPFLIIPRSGVLQRPGQLLPGGHRRLPRRGAGGRGGGPGAAGARLAGQAHRHRQERLVPHRQHLRPPGRGAGPAGGRRRPGGGAQGGEVAAGVGGPGEGSYRHRSRHARWHGRRQGRRDGERPRRRLHAGDDPERFGSTSAWSP